MSERNREWGVKIKQRKEKRERERENEDKRRGGKINKCIIEKEKEKKEGEERGECEG